MRDWLPNHTVFLGWLFGLSALFFFGSIIALPWIVVRIPADYFVRRRQLTDCWRLDQPLWRLILRILKNLCGIVLVLTGIAMLVLPGQGIVTILVGFMFLDFPGKLAFERYLVARRPVERAINWMRKKAGRPPLIVPRLEKKRARQKKP